MADDIEIKFPLEGRDDSQTPGRQQQLTTSEAVNVRGVVPLTGRNGGGSRAGTRKACEAQLGSAAVRDLAQCVFDTRRIEYGVRDDPELVWAITGKSNGDAFDIQCDAGGNVYFADGGKSIEVRNTDQVVVATIALPCDDTDAVCRALAIDTGSRVFAGVSDGSDQTLARMWCYERDAYGGYRMLWQIGPEQGLRGFVERLEVHAGRLHALVNDRARGRAYLQVWRDPDAAVPTLDWQHVCSAPAISMAIAPNGDIAVGAAQVTIRASDPAAPQSTQILDPELADFRIAQLDDFRLRQWEWVRSRDVEGEDGDDVLQMVGRWFGRAVYCPVGITRASVTVTAPKIKDEGTLGGRRGIRFNALDNVLVSLPNPSKSASADDTQKTLLPAYAGGGFAAFIMFRADRDETQPSTLSSVILAQDVPSQNHRRIVANKDDTGPMSGVVHVTEDSGTEIGGFASFDNSNSGGLISWIVDSTGNVDLYFNGTRLTPDSGSIPYASTLFASLVLTEIGQSSIGGTPDPAYFGGELYEVLVLRDYTSSTTGLRTVCSDSDRQITEGALMWEYGLAALLPVGHPYRGVPPASPRETTARYTNAQKFMSPTPIITKFGGLTHKIAWVLASDVTTPAGIGGLGYGLAFNSEGDLYSVGPPIASTGPATDPSWASIRKIIDNGDSYSIDPADGAWAVTLGTTAQETFSYDKLRLAVDSFDNVFIPFFADGYGSAAPSFLAYDKMGVLLLDPDSVPPQGAHSIAISPLVPDFEGNPTPITRPEHIYLARRRVRPVTIQRVGGVIAAGDTITFTPSTGTPEVYTFAGVALIPGDVLIGASVEETRENLINAIMGGPIGTPATYVSASLTGSALLTAVAVTPESTVFKMEFGLRVPGAITVTVALSSSALSFIGVSTVIEATPTVEKFNLLTQTQINDSGRARTLLGVSGADIVTFDLGASAIVPTGGSGALDAAARYVQSATLAGRVFYTDGINYKLFEGRTGVVSAYTSTGYGAIPPRCTGIEAWRAGIFLFGDPDDASNYFLSEQGNPFGFDFYPDVVTEVTATWGRVGAAGVPDDIITGFCPYVDGYGLVFCDHSLWSITGNPSPGSNGRIQQVSKITGAAPGHTWCIGPKGEVFFWGGQSGLWVFTGGEATCLSDARFKRTLRGIDLSQFYVRTAWDWTFNGLNMMLCPYGGVTADARCYFWEQDNGAFWEDERSNTAHQPTSVIVLDGDLPQDRRTIFGCRDGYVRTFDELKDNDDGTPIFSRVLIGPLSSQGTRWNTLISRLQIIIESSMGECTVALYTSDTPSNKGEMKRVYRVRPGTNNFSARFQAPYVWLEISSAQRWAFEAAILAVEPGSFKQPSRSTR